MVCQEQSIGVASVGRGANLQTRLLGLSGQCVNCRHRRPLLLDRNVAYHVECPLHAYH
eukprot:SAG25_NODE_14337_length_256_cov_0.656051_1_plen_57_part_01